MGKLIFVLLIMLLSSSLASAAIKYYNVDSGDDIVYLGEFKKNPDYWENRDRDYRYYSDYDLDYKRYHYDKDYRYYESYRYYDLDDDEELDRYYYEEVYLNNKRHPKYDYRHGYTYRDTREFEEKYWKKRISYRDRERDKPYISSREYYYYDENPYTGEKYEVKCYLNPPKGKIFYRKCS